MKTVERSIGAAECWSCAAVLSAGQLFCAACGKLQPPPTADYFQVFGLPQKLHLDVALLERSFYRLSRKLHPDVYARATSEEQHWSLVNSSLLNDAYRTLKDPLSRTEYLLTLGDPEGEGTKPGGSNDPSRAPADLLEEVFDLNMQLDELRAAQRAGEYDPALRESLLGSEKRFEAQLERTDAELTGLWAAWDSALESNNEHLKIESKKGMAALLDRRRYISNLVRDANQALES